MLSLLVSPLLKDKDPNLLGNNHKRFLLYSVCISEIGQPSCTLFFWSFSAWFAEPKIMPGTSGEGLCVLRLSVVLFGELAGRIDRANVGIRRIGSLGSKHVLPQRLAALHRDHPLGTYRWLLRAPLVGWSVPIEPPPRTAPRAIWVK